MSLLQINGLTKHFGGLVAVSDMSFEIEEGEIVGLIGPNGAGKTTVFNLISGIFPPDRGRIFLGGQDITPLKLHVKSQLGIGRTFQIVRPFENMTVLENVMVPILARFQELGEAREAASTVLRQLGLSAQAFSEPQSLTYAQRKRLEVARALATKPKILLLDEVLAGLNPVEVEEALPLVRHLRDSGVTIFIIEHVMAALMSVSDRVLVMDQGRLIASGTPSEVTANPQVIKAYLGEEISRA
ncbi:MAG TPA: ABC transporter ATP-binding protein [Thermodesulfobacteriota bacterium]|nr:ABC transporter ATP-binding protein [Thermodesulfobacteriota bacterium]